MQKNHMEQNINFKSKKRKRTSLKHYNDPLLNTRIIRYMFMKTLDYENIGDYNIGKKGQVLIAFVGMITDLFIRWTKINI